MWQQHPVNKQEPEEQKDEKAAVEQQLRIGVVNKLTEYFVGIQFHHGAANVRHERVMSFHPKKQLII
jgi:hypothetical protein